MRDATSISRIKQLHPAIADEVTAIIDEVENGLPENCKIRIVQGLRTIEEQNALFAQGRNKPGSIVTNARGGSSYHNYGLAFDFAIMYDKDNNGGFEVLSWDTNYDFDKDGIKDWQEMVKAFKDRGYEWGGDWKTIQDDPHLQKSFGYSWKQLFEKYQAEDFIPGTQYVNL